MIQCRTKWNGEAWSDWTPDAYSRTFDVCEGSWREIRGFLEMCRSQREPDDGAGIGPANSSTANWQHFLGAEKISLLT